MSAQRRFRRALTLLTMTLLVPGSAQLVAGDDRLGRMALRTWLGMWAALLGVVLLGMARPGAVITLFTNPAVLALLRVVLIAAAVGWAALLFDAWRLGDPRELGQPQRLAVFSLGGGLCVAVAGSLLFASHVVAVQRDFIETVFGTGPAAAADDGRYNVLLLGGDSGPTRDGLRPDSITVASIDAESGRIVLFGLPRNLEDVPFPDGSVMQERFPRGFNCSGCYLNAVHTWAENHADLFPPEVAAPGLEATRQAVAASTGLQISYTAMVDLGGFRQLVDALGGVTLHVPEAVPIGSTGNIRDWIQPGRQHLDGFQTLWFTRSRATSDDYSRMARQKCVLGALLHQVEPRTVLAHFQEVAEAGQQIMTTDIPASEVDRFVELALKARQLPVATVSFVPPLVRTYDPSFESIRGLVERALDRSEAADSGEPAATPNNRAAKTERPSDAANLSADLTSAC